MIRSTQNKNVKEWKKLHSKKGRNQSNSFLIEGYHLIEEAYSTEQNIKELILQEGIENPGWLQDDFVSYVSESVFNEITQTDTPQGIAAVVAKQSIATKDKNYVLLLDAIQDPGNLGTMIRTADAAGFSKIILGEGTVDLYNDKVIRATQGSIFHIAIEQGSLTSVIPSLKEQGFSIWGTTLKRAQNYANLSAEGKIALLLGNEGRGVSQKLLELADQLVKIPIYGRAESLNVGIAAGILMYHLRK